MIANDPLALTSPDVARAVSDLLQSSVVDGTLSSYNSGFNSLVSFCRSVGQPAMPVRNTILVAFMHHLSHKRDPVKPSTIKKYLSGIRFMHIVNGFPWSLSDDPLVLLGKRAIAKRFPEATQRLKIPISIGMLLSMCALIVGWPDPARLSFEDLLWVTASTIMLFGALRGGELTRVRGSSRPVLVGSDVFSFKIREHDGSFSSGVRIRIRAPKTEPGSVFQEASAIDASNHFALNPSFWLDAYRIRAASMHLNVLDDQPAFKCARGLPVTRDFMVGKANDLRVRSGVAVLDADGSHVPFLAASWRAGYVLSARAAGIPEFLIRKAGRWASEGGPAPYTFASIVELRSASRAMAASAHTAPLSATFDVGRFNSSCVFEHFSV